MLIWKCEGRREWFVDRGHVASEGNAGFISWRPLPYSTLEGQEVIDNFQGSFYMCIFQ